MHVPIRAPGETPPARRDSGRGSRLVALALAALLLASATAARAARPTREDCLACHGDDPTISMQRRGKTVSLFVKAGVLAASAHDTLACVDCHAGFDPDETPHKDPITPVNCGSCHQAIQALHAKSLHGQAIARGDPLAPRCKDCHGNHDIVPVKDPRSPVAPLQDSVPVRQVPPRGRARPAPARRSTQTTSSRTTPRASTARLCSRRG